MNIQEIKNLLNKVNSELDEIKINLENIKKEIEAQNFKDLNEFESLKKILLSEEWPEAVLDFQIVDESSEEEKMDRAEGIVDILIDESLENKKFLDFGCGEGHMAKYASTQKTIYSMGYDIVKDYRLKLSWEIEGGNHMLTTNFEKVKEKGPYDIILIYDVLDHADNPKDVLCKAKSVLSDNGKIYLRCHPWCGRHGGHYYRKINKAFVHLILEEKEINEMGYFLEEKNNKFLFPLRTYNEIISNSELVVVKEDVERQDVEDFFCKNELVKNRLLNLYQIKEWGETPNFQMSQCFVDYVLTK